MRAGQLRFVIKIQQKIVEKTEFGEEIENWNDFKTVRANLTIKKVIRNIEDYEIFNTQTTDFVTRLDNNITEDMRINFENKTYQIVCIDKNLWDRSMTIKAEKILL